MASLVREARGGDIATATRCELALRGIMHPTLEQVAGAALCALHRDDTRVLALGMVREAPGNMRAQTTETATEGSVGTIYDSRTRELHHAGSDGSEETE